MPSSVGEEAAEVQAADKAEVQIGQNLKTLDGPMLAAGMPLLKMKAVPGDRHWCGMP